MQSRSLTAAQAQNIREWIAALRSGKFKQGPGRLKAGYGGDGFFVYCCLGVACELKDPEWLEKNRMSMLMPDVERFEELFGIRDTSIDIVSQGDLSSLNDGQWTTEGDETSFDRPLGLDFNDIAMVLELFLLMNNKRI